MDPIEQAVRRKVRKDMRKEYGRSYSQHEYESNVQFELDWVIPDRLIELLYGESNE